MTQYKSRRAARKAWEKAIKKETGGKKELFHVEISHDEYCGVFEQAECNCNPYRRFFNASGKLIIDVRGVGFYDPFEVTGVSNV